MQHGDRIIFCHIDLIKNAETTPDCAVIHRTCPKLHFVVAEGVRANQRTAVHIYMERNIPGRPAENVSQIFC